jgi:hypothetical protein
MTNRRLLLVHRLALVALAGAGGHALISHLPSATAASDPHRLARTTLPETEWPRSSVNTFRNHHAVSGKGRPVAASQTVRVSCRVYDPSIPSISPSGFWYRIASAPWSNRYWAPANTFLNGDRPRGPYHHPVEKKVPLC